MSVSRGDTITQADMDALADLANAAIGPLVAGYPSGTLGVEFLENGYEFSYMDGDVLPPTNVEGVASAGSGEYSMSLFDGGNVTIRVYSYKTISGRKHYSKQYATGVCTLTTLAQNTIDWTWDAASGVDGYILTTGFPSDGWDIHEVERHGYFGFWHKTTGTSFTDQFFVYGSDIATDWIPSDDLIGDGTYTLVNPVTSGTWRRMLQYIKEDLFIITEQASPPITQADMVVSGPWCCAVGKRLRGGSLFSDNYTDVEFWYAADDHSGDVDVALEIEVGTTDVPVSLLNQLGFGDRPDWEHTISYNSSQAAVVVSGEITWRQTGSGTGWTHTLTVMSGSVTIDSETWTETSTTLTLAFTFTIPSGSSSLKIEVEAADGDIASELDGTTGDGYGFVSSVALFDTATITPVSAVALHSSSAAKKISITGLDPDAITLTFGGGSYYASLRAEEINGVWVAKTVPPVAEHVYLENDLPQYPYEIGIEIGPRGQVPPSYNEIPGVNGITPSVNGKPSIWPVFRDTDMLEWKYNVGRTTAAPVPFFGNGSFAKTTSITIEPDGVYETSLSLAINFEQSKIEVIGASLPIYFGQTTQPDPDNPSTYDGFVTTPLRTPSDYTPTPGTPLLLTIKNTTASPVTISVRSWAFYSQGSYNPGDVPIFFLRDTDGVGAAEEYSYNIGDSKKQTSVFSGYAGVNERPLSGYCITQIKIQRAATGGLSKIVSSTGEAALDVAIGLMRGTTSDAAGTFDEIETMTIQADNASVTETKFWPVLEGCALVYQCTEAVEIFASVNFMPEVLTQFYPPRGETSYATPIYGTHSGPPIPFQTNVLRINNRSTNHPGTNKHVTWPASPAIYNDLEAILNLL